MTQFITSNLENHNQIQQTGFTANLNALFPWPPLMPKHREWHIILQILSQTCCLATIRLSTDFVMFFIEMISLAFDNKIYFDTKYIFFIWPYLKSTVSNTLISDLNNITQINKIFDSLEKK
jgi:hypothetical protein